MPGNELLRRIVAHFGAFRAKAACFRRSMHAKGRRLRRWLVAPLTIVGLLTTSVPVYATTCPTSGTDVVISVSCQFDAGTYTFTGTLTINAGVTVTAASNVGS